MSAPNGSSGSGGILLEEWRKDVPPGWGPGIESYPLKLFFNKLKLWYRCTEVPDEIVGPLVAGRLVGRAQRIALELRLIRPDGTYDIGDAALVRLSVDQVLDPNDGITVIQHHIPSGVQALCNALKEAFGESDEAQTTKALETFFEYRRPPSQGLQEFSAEWELRFEEAKVKAGLDVNDVAKTYLWLKQSNLPPRHQDDLRLQVQGDLSRFHDIRALALRLSHRVDRTNNDNFYEENQWGENNSSEWTEEAYWTDDQWMDEPWYFDEDYYLDTEEYPWYGDETYYDDYEYHGEWQGDPDLEPGHQGGADDASEADGVYSAGGYRGGKGKGKGPFGSGCHICGSKWHHAADCPVNSKGKGFGGRPFLKGKGKGFKGRGKGKSKSKGKGKGKWSRKGSFSSPDGPRSWVPRYYADQTDHYDNSPKATRQLRHAQQGLSLGDPVSGPPRAPQAQYFNMAKDDGAKATYFEDLLRLERAATSTAKDQNATTAQDDGTAAGSGETKEYPAKRLAFFFRKSVDGEEVRTPRHATHYGHSDGTEVFHTIQGRRRRGLIIDPGAANGLVGSETLRDLLQHCDLRDQVNETISWSEKQSEVTGISGSADTTLGEVCLQLPMLGGLRDACYVADVVGGEASCCPALVGNPALVKMGAIIAANWFENKDGLLIVPGSSGDGQEMQLLRLLYTDSRHYMLPLDEVESAQQERDKAQTFLSVVHEKSASTWKDVRGTWFFSGTRDMPEPKRSHRTEAPLAQKPSDPMTTESLPVLPQKPSDPTTESVPVLSQKPSDPTTESVPVLPRGPSAPAQGALLHSSLVTVEKLHSSLVTANAQDKSPGGSPVKTVRFQQPDSELPTSMITDEAMQVASVEAEFSRPTRYPGDQYPDGLPVEYTKKLDQHYKRMKEEYYSKSGKQPVSPRNYSRWCRTRASRTPVQLWELFSGSSRLSYLALLAGLTVAFPVDFRYGWNLGCREHQDMILDAQERMNPEVIVMSPSFSAWSRPSSQQSLTNEELKELEASTMQFVKVLACRQAEKGHGFLLEQPWTSPTWRHSVLATLQNDVSGCRPKQRTDQCCFGVANDKNQPMMRATALQGNLSVRNATRRCQGHVNGHGKMLGSICTTANSSGVFPHALCSALIKDIKKHLVRNGKHLRAVYHSGASDPASSSNDPAVVRRAVVTPLPQLVEEFRQAALKRANLDEVLLQWPEGVTVPAVDSLMLKHLLLCLVEDSVNVISEQKGKHNHWSQDPVHLAVLRKIFGRYLDVKGVCTSLQAERLPLPMPFLRTESAPYRLIIRGEVKKWTVKTTEDLRTLTTDQLNKKVFAEDWVVAIFGSTAKELLCSPLVKTRDQSLWRSSPSTARPLRSPTTLLGPRL